MPRLGCEELPLASPVSFREVWGQVVSKGSSLDFLMHSVIGVPCKLVHSPSLQFSFEFYSWPPIVGSLENC